jgi:hypothetical protein
MSRQYQEDIANEKVKRLLEILVDTSVSADTYGEIMYQLGLAFGPLIRKRVKEKSAVTLACTVEDADHLARGIIDYLEHHKSKVFLNVFWNKRFKPAGISVAPIVKQYHDKESIKTSTIIIIKSIISSSCVVRTNLTRLIEEYVPEQILVVAPVLMKGSLQKLESEFDAAISRKFEYLYFAEDDVRKDGIIIPGIGGDIYQRLGFTDQEDKNRYIPRIVKLRRKKIG